MANNRLTNAQIRAALIATGGAMALAAKRLKVSRQAIWKRIQQSDDLQAVVADQREELLDLAESALKASLKKREAWAVCFTLKTIGKKRGYIEKTETDITSGGKPVRFTLNLGGPVGDREPGDDA